MGAYLMEKVFNLLTLDSELRTQNSELRTPPPMALLFISPLLPLDYHTRDN
jgi:hypothetical protein